MISTTPIIAMLTETAPKETKEFSPGNTEPRSTSFDDFLSRAADTTTPEKQPSNATNKEETSHTEELRENNVKVSDKNHEETKTDRTEKKSSDTKEAEGSEKRAEEVGDKKSPEELLAHLAKESLLSEELQAPKADLSEMTPKEAVKSLESLQRDVEELLLCLQNMGAPKELIKEVKELGKLIDETKKLPPVDLKQNFSAKIKEMVASLENILKGTDKVPPQFEKALGDVLSKATDLLEQLSPAVRRPAPRNIASPSAESSSPQNIAPKEETLASQVLQNSGSANHEGTSEQGSGHSFQHQLRTQSAHLQAQSQSTLPKSPAFQQELNQIVQNARVFVRDGRNGSFQVKLYPRELGNVTVNLGLEQGVVSGKFLVESNEARSLLMDNLALVKEQLKDAGIDIGEFQVNVRDQNQGGHHEREEGHSPSIPMSETAQQNSIYERSSQALHDGAINMVI